MFNNNNIYYLNLNQLIYLNYNFFLIIYIIFIQYYQ